MTDITIPAEALEAAAIDLHRLVYDEPDSFSWAETDEGTRTHFRTIAHAACIAMLKAWPEMCHYKPNAEPYYGKHIILPLTQESGNE